MCYSGGGSKVKGQWEGFTFQERRDVHLDSVNGVCMSGVQCSGSTYLDKSMDATVRQKESNGTLRI